MYKLLLSVLLPSLLPVSLMACKCLVSYPVCNEVATSDLVFIGTVESVEPAFLDPWNPTRLSLLPTAEIMRLREEGTPASLARLKEIYSQLYPNMPDQYKTRLRAARTHLELESVIQAIGGEGIQTRMRVKKYFKREDDDPGDKDADNDKDADKDDDKKDDAKEDVVTVWTLADDCGYNFQKGETYLVYSDSDEETGRIETSICTRTKRLTDAGPDLAYLYFRENFGENGGDASTRLEGFVTDEAFQDISRFADAVHSPVPDVMLELKAGGGSRYARTGPDGRFIFDGLAEGKYSLTPFDGNYPTEVMPLAEPTQFSAEKNSCAREILTVPKPDPKRPPAN